MTSRERRRQSLLRTIEQWMRRHGAWFVFALCFSAWTAETGHAAEVKAALANAAKTPAVVSAEKKTYTPKFYYRKTTKAETKLETEAKTVQGKLSARGTNGLEIQVGIDKEKGTSNDMWFEYREGMKLGGAKKLSDFNEGDIIKVGYNEAKDHSKRMMTELTLLRHKPQDLESLQDKASAP